MMKNYQLLLPIMPIFIFFGPFSPLAKLLSHAAKVAGGTIGNNGRTVPHRGGE